MDRELTGRQGIITGGSSGIGYAMANELADAGAIVYVISRSGCVKDGLPESHEGVIHLKGDVTNRQEMQERIDEIASKGGLDFLINNAGATHKCRAENFPMEEFEHILRVNVTAIFSMCQLCFPYLKASPHKGRVINISSMSAHLGFTEVAPYCTSKAAVCGMTRALAVEWANDNICVNSIAPGWFPSEMFQSVLTPERKAAILARMPVHAFGDPKDLGKLARFLIGDGASYMTGQDIAMDGGALDYGY